MSDDARSKMDGNDAMKRSGVAGGRVRRTTLRKKPAPFRTSPEARKCVRNRSARIPIPRWRTLTGGGRPAARLNRECVRDRRHGKPEAARRSALRTQLLPPPSFLHRAQERPRNLGAGTLASWPQPPALAGSKSHFGLSRGTGKALSRSTRQQRGPESRRYRTGTPGRRVQANLRSQGTRTRRDVRLLHGPADRNHTRGNREQL
eukprot:scaffold177_cov334-Pavlova_lutheri.AAC.92